MSRIMTDAETLAIGLAYPATPQGRIIAAWRHGVLEIVLERDSVEHLARIFHRYIGRLGWSVLDVNDLIAAIRLAVIDVPPRGWRDLPSAPGGKLGLPQGAAYYVSDAEDVLALAEIHPVMTPKRFWETFG
ncbi:hypothetical protein WV31_04735 [Magnetospirillum sp. ME-1]|uniref:hypothetical protein n=1 Tax=Magnetospirillum sp. ME-1 TaxID=1639348 RepID=UPI000A17A8F8|nr:hypothetical protein [Magnetospirillum sp. ME-1]ARJ65020.1 hypothetical protein WV31_04735 [Magnetospirillum sp. ME-1]